MTSFVYKYRPKTIDDIVGNVDTVNIVRHILSCNDLPNMLFIGPPGTGKTSLIGVLVSTFKQVSIDINGSEERGIDIVRNDIQLFAKNMIRLVDGKYKIVVIEEADNMTVHAQQELARVMDMHGNGTRFLISCSDSTSIVDMIQSRVLICRLIALSSVDIISHIRKVCILEGIPVDMDSSTCVSEGESDVDMVDEDEGDVDWKEIKRNSIVGGLEAIAYISDGDMRNALNNLQSTYYGYGIVNKENVYAICDTVVPEHMFTIIELATKGNLNRACELVKEIYDEGYSSVDIITLMFKVMVSPPIIDRLSENLRLIIIEEISTTHMRVIEGVESLLQLDKLLSRMFLLSSRFYSVDDV